MHQRVEGWRGKWIGEFLDNWFLVDYPALSLVNNSYNKNYLNIDDLMISSGNFTNLINSRDVILQNICFEISRNICSDQFNSVERLKCVVFSCPKVQINLM